ncbi:hypothetical protein WJX72_006891 [[Myrmecia] bisecta]|uniref:Chloride conductance regulatory protein ICln n=1 Tax=[Myrmecia] bisecta TaxID=41462 RepID=A0AAW1QRY6_9CHLO
MVSPADSETAAAYGLHPFAEITDGQPVLDQEDDEALAGSYPQVSLVLGADLDQGPGTLFITTRRVIWLQAAQPPGGYAVDYQTITMHALSQDPEAFDRPCIYAQLEASTSGEYDENDEEEEVSPELRLVPADSAALPDMFQKLCECAALNPDPGQDDDDDEDGENDFFYDEDEVLAGAGAEQRAARLNHYDALLQMPSADQFQEMVEDDDKFADAEDDEDRPLDQHPNGQHQPAH